MGAIFLILATLLSAVWTLTVRGLLDLGAPPLLCAALLLLLPVVLHRWYSSIEDWDDYVL